MSIGSKPEEAVDVVPSGKKKESQGTHSHIEHSVTEREALHKDSGEKVEEGRDKARQE